MITLFNQIIKWFEPSQQSELERYIQTRGPQSAGELDKLINEYSYKKQGGWL
jgi:hypothetical protein